MLSIPVNKAEFQRQRQVKNPDVPLKEALWVPGHNLSPNSMIFILWYHLTTICTPDDVAQFHNATYSAQTRTPITSQDVVDIIDHLVKQYHANGDSWRLTEKFDKPQNLGMAACDHGLDCHAVKRSVKWTRQLTQTAELATNLWKGSYTELLRCPRFHRSPTSSSSSSSDHSRPPSLLSSRRPRVQRQPLTYSSRRDAALGLSNWSAARATFRAGLVVVLALLWYDLLVLTLAKLSPFSRTPGTTIIVCLTLAILIPALVVALEVLYRGQPLLSRSIRGDGPVGGILLVPQGYNLIQCARLFRQVSILTVLLFVILDAFNLLPIIFDRPKTFITRSWDTKEMETLLTRICARIGLASSDAQLKLVRERRGYAMHNAEQLVEA